MSTLRIYIFKPYSKVYIRYSFGNGTSIAIAVIAGTGVCSINNCIYATT